MNRYGSIDVHILPTNMDLYLTTILSVGSATRTDSSSRKILVCEILVKYLKRLECGATHNGSQANECGLAKVYFTLWQTAQAEPGYVGLREQKQLMKRRENCPATLE